MPPARNAGYPGFVIVDDAWFRWRGRFCCCSVFVERLGQMMWVRPLGVQVVDHFFEKLGMYRTAAVLAVVAELSGQLVDRFLYCLFVGLCG